MARAATIAVSRFQQILTGAQGLRAAAAAIEDAAVETVCPIQDEQVFLQNISADLAEKARRVRYPALYLYCDRVKNGLREKFRTFSGKVALAVEVRVSQDHLNGLEHLLHLQIEVVTQVLDSNRGDWGDGLFYAGEYDVTFMAAKHGGSNYVQSGKVLFEVDLSS